MTVVFLYHLFFDAYELFLESTGMETKKKPFFLKEIVESLEDQSHIWS